MEDVERKELTWKIKKSLHALTAEELFQIVEAIAPVPDLDHSADEEILVLLYILLPEL